MVKSTPAKNLAQAGIMVYDIQLYLDTHPDDIQALDAFAEYKAAYDVAKRDYENTYGPLTASSSSARDYFEWVNGPWPWEGGIV